MSTAAAATVHHPSDGPSDHLRFVVTPLIRDALARACGAFDSRATPQAATKETREAVRRLHRDKAAGEVPLGLLRQLSRVLREMDSRDGAEQQPAHLNELLRGSRPVVPRPPPPPKRTPDQEAMFKNLQLELDNKRYASMVKNVVATKSMQEGKQKNEYREAMKQASLGVDMIVAIIVGFVAGFFLFSRWGTVWGVIGGTLSAVVIMLVEMALVVIRGSRIEKKEEEKAKTKFLPKKKNTKPATTIISSTVIPGVPHK